MASLTSSIWKSVSYDCKEDASEEFSSGLQVLTQYCAEARGAVAQATTNQATVTKTSGIHFYNTIISSMEQHVKQQLMMFHK